MAASVMFKRNVTSNHYSISIQSQNITSLFSIKTLDECNGRHIIDSEDRDLVRNKEGLPTGGPWIDHHITRFDRVRRN